MTPTTLRDRLWFNARSQTPTLEPKDCAEILQELEWQDEKIRELEAKLMNRRAMCESQEIPSPRPAAPTRWSSTMAKLWEWGDK